MPKVRVAHGHWGEVYVNAQLVGEVTAIDYTIEIERIDVPQVGTRWNTFHEGNITGEGTLTIYKAYSDFEGAFLPYTSLDATELRRRRDAGQPLRPSVSIKVAIDDPHGEPGREFETLVGVQFWRYTGGFNITEIINREWPFSFEGIVAPQGSRILRNGSGSLY